MKTALGWLVRLFPESFRERFGAAMVEHAALDCERERARAAGWPARGRRSRPRFDLCRAALAERLRPTWTPASPTREGGRPWA